MEVIKLNNENFEQEVQKQSGIVLVDFYAEWCGPCKMLSPIVDEIAKERADIKVGKVNIDESSELAIQHRVMSVPTLLVMQNGKELARSVGYKAKQEILSMLNV